jgi:hypothetical protein
MNSNLHERRRQGGEVVRVAAHVSVTKADCVYKVGLPPLFAPSSLSFPHYLNPQTQWPSLVEDFAKLVTTTHVIYVLGS